MNNFFRLLTLLNTLDRASTCDPSSYNVVTSCYESFFNHYNFSIVETMRFPNYMDFVDARGQLEFASPHDNFIKDCTVQSRLTSCLGTAVACVNSTDLLKIFKFHKHDNQEYTGDYYMNTYKCTTAYSYITSNYNCLTTADHLSKDAITKCFSDMLTSPENEMCEAGNTLIQCLNAIYSSYCGPKAADFVCNVAKIDMTYDIPQCSSKIMKCNPL